MPEYLQQKSRQSEVDYKALQASLEAKEKKDAISKLEAVAAAAEAEEGHGVEERLSGKKRPATGEPPAAEEEGTAKQRGSSAAAASGGGAGGKDAAQQPERKDAKERVKQQRLAGQSGIGADFRVWRTEEEMQMRYQYDG